MRMHMIWFTTTTEPPTISDLTKLSFQIVGGSVVE